jgi:hypothetical protein
VVNARAKGQRGELEAMKACEELIQAPKSIYNKRNSQATPYGGSATPDITIHQLRKFHMEVKNTSNVSFFAWANKLLEDVLGTSKTPMILYKQPAKKHPNNKATWWVFHRLTDIEEIVLTWAPALGYKVEKEENNV